MNKTKSISLAIFVVLLSIGLTFYARYTSKNNINSSLFSAVSNRTAAFFYTENINDLLSKLDNQQNYDILNQSIFLEVFKETKSHLDSLFSNVENFNPEENELLFTLNNIGSSKIGILTILKLKNNLHLNHFLHPLIEEKYSMDEYKFQNSKIYTIQGFQNKNALSFSMVNNLLLTSANVTLVEEAINTMNKDNSKTNQSEFKSLISKKDSNASLHLFTDLKAMNDIESILFNPSFSIIKTSKDLFHWTYTAIDFNEENIKFKTHFGAENLPISKGSKFSLDAFLPNNTAYFETFCSADNYGFLSEDNSYKYFNPWIDGEIAFFCLETFDANFQKKAGLVIKTKNVKDAKNNLKEMNAEMTPIHSQNEFPVYKMNVNTISKIFPHTFLKFEFPYFAFIGKNVVFANDLNVILNCHQKFKRNKFLKGDVKFQEFIANPTVNKILYLNSNKWTNTLNHIFKENVFPIPFGKLKMEFYQTDSSHNAKGEILLGSVLENKSTLLWETSLDTISTFPPNIVYNIEKKQKQIFTQNENKEIFLLNSSGEILFKKQIEEKILSEVFTIDLHKANKTQFVFNTKNYIYLLNSNGKIVDGFPLKLPSAASNSIQVVNYDNAKNYRFFIACKNNKVYGYEAKGKPLKSWSPLGTFGEIDQKIQHTVFKGKDYLYFNDIKGNFYAYNRKGEQRFSPSILDSHFKNKFESSKNGFIGFSEGTVFKIDLAGKTTVKIIEDATFNKFKSYPEKQAFAIANDRRFKVAKSKWTILSETKLNDKILEIESINIHDEKWFLVHCSQSTYLIHEDGKIHNDFPVLSSSKPSISNFFENKNETIFYQEGKTLKAFELYTPRE